MNDDDDERAAKIERLNHRIAKLRAKVRRLEARQAAAAPPVECFAVYEASDGERREVWFTYPSIALALERARAAGYTQAIVGRCASSSSTSFSGAPRRYTFDNGTWSEAIQQHEIGFADAAHLVLFGSYHHRIAIKMPRRGVFQFRLDYRQDAPACAEVEGYADGLLMSRMISVGDAQSMRDAFVVAAVDATVIVSVRNGCNAGALVIRMDSIGCVA